MTFQKGNDYWKLSKGNSGNRYKLKERRSEESRKNYSESKKGSKNPNWSGDDIKSINALHTWVKRRLPKPKECPSCQRVVRLELCNVSPKHNPETYTRDLKNWFYSCRKCHMNGDGRMNNLISFQKGQKPWCTGIKLPYMTERNLSEDSPFKRPEVIEKRIETLKKRYVDGTVVSWAKGKKIGSAAMLKAWETRRKRNVK